MEDVSLFHAYPKKHLAFIIKELLDNDFDWEDPYADDDNIGILEAAAAPFNEGISDIDMEFFAKLIEINEQIALLIQTSKPNKNLYERLELPKLEKYKVYWKEWGSCHFTRYYNDEWSSYDGNWVQSAMDSAHNHGNWDKWSADSDTEYDDCETYDDTVTDIEKIDTNKTTNESIFDKLIKEDTSYEIDSLDRKSLLILKSIIDKKLGL